MKKATLKHAPLSIAIFALCNTFPNNLIAMESELPGDFAGSTESMNPNLTPQSKSSSVESIDSEKFKALIVSSAESTPNQSPAPTRRLDKMKNDLQELPEEEELKTISEEEKKNKKNKLKKRRSYNEKDINQEKRILQVIYDMIPE